MKDESHNPLWECEICGQGVHSRTIAGASSSDICPHQMDRPKPGANISIENSRQIAAKRKRKTEAPNL